MATAVKKAACSICGKEKGGVRCEGCSNIFCLSHFDGHRQELAEPQNHVLMEQIDEWEKESTNKIRQAAEKARRILLKHTAELNTKMENELNKLTNQLRQSREENDFSETDLNQWKQELTQMQNELDNPSNITVRQDRTALVTNINVDISDRSPRYTTSDDGTLIPCEWCNQKVSLHMYQKHLEACQEKEHERLQEKAQRNSQITESATIVNSRTPPVTTVNIRTPSITSFNIQTPSGTDSAPCKFCGRSMSSNGLSYHQLICVKNLQRNKN